MLLVTCAKSYLFNTSRNRLEVGISHRHQIRSKEILFIIFIKSFESNIIHLIKNSAQYELRERTYDVVYRKTSFAF